MPSNWRVHAKHVTPISPGHSGLASIPLGLRCGSSRNPGKTSEIACGILANSEEEKCPREISVSGGSPPARTRAANREDAVWRALDNPFDHVQPEDTARTGP